MTNDSELETIRRVFIAEAEDALVTMEQALVTLERAPDDADAIAALFRILHTLKGSAAMAAADEIAEFSHLLEDALELFRTGAVAITPSHVTMLLQAVDSLRGMLVATASGRISQVRASDRALIARLVPARLLARNGNVFAGAEAAAGVEPARPDDRSASDGRRGEDSTRSLRVRMDKLDALLDLTGEIAVARGRLMQQLFGGAADAGDGSRIAAEELDRLFGQLQEHVMQLRLVTLGPAFRQHLRTVRDVAAAEGKLARLVLEGEDVEVDAAIVDQLRDPLTHMIRNAIDHGLEMPADRTAADKDPCGTVTLRARHEHGTVMIEVEDDGGGIDRDRVLARGRAAGLVAEGAEPADAELFRLVTMPGFSTSERITELSGRGVGMDVVRRNVEALRGTLSITSRRGQGTTVAARVPLTLAIIQGFGVGVGDETFVLPLDAISECVQLPATHQADGARGGLVNLRETPLPFVRLRHLLGIGGDAPVRENIVVVEHDGARLGLAVDDLFGQSETVIKSLGGLFRGLPGVIGTTILGNGRVALILDVPVLLQRAAHDALAGDVAGADAVQRSTALAAAH